MWQHALMLPDPKDGWTWATGSVLGLPNLVRVLVTLHRAGIREVVLPPDGLGLRDGCGSAQGRSDMPVVRGWEDAEWLHRSSPVLGIRGGVLFTPQLLSWFQAALAGSATGKASRHVADSLPVLIAFRPTEVERHALQSWTWARLASHTVVPTVRVPADIWCHTAHEVARRDRVLLSSVGKATDRWHVEWVRRWTFPVLRGLARIGVKPNAVTWAGCGVALLACWCIAQGTYWSGIWGALLLYASWVLDCMDGTLARLTLAESPFGQKLDTVLGHLSNLCIFAALIWAVYGREPAWQGAVVALFILGGMMLAQRLSTMSKKMHDSRSMSEPGRLRAFLEKINHRDYAVLIFVLAIVQGFHVFLWLSLVGIQVYWLLQLWLLRRRLAHPG